LILVLYRRINCDKMDYIGEKAIIGDMMNIKWEVK